MNQTTILVLLAAAILVFFVARANASGSRVSNEDAHALVAEGAQLVDVRTPEEFAAGHITGAVNIPVQDLQARMAEIDRDRAVIVYCRSGMRSANAARTLQAAGYESVHDLGPMTAWR